MDLDKQEQVLGASLSGEGRLVIEEKAGVSGRPRRWTAGNGKCLAGCGEDPGPSLSP